MEITALSEYSEGLQLRARLMENHSKKKESRVCPK